MKKLMVAVPAALALALAVSACGKTDTADNAAASNELLLNDEGALDANGAGDAPSTAGGATDNFSIGNVSIGEGSSGDASADNGAAALGNGQ